VAGVASVEKRLDALLKYLTAPERVLTSTAAVSVQSGRITNVFN
jgi:hypothetical protein